MEKMLNNQPPTDYSALQLAGSDFILNHQLIHTDNSFCVINPANNQHLANVSAATNDHAQQAISFAAQALPKWMKQTGKQRATILRRWFDLVIQHQETLATLITLENGKTLAEARAEVLYGASYIEWFAEEAKRIRGDTLSSPMPDKRMWITQQAVGVCGAITPWNFPFVIAARKIAPALAAGCTMILKPAEQTPLTALSMAKLAIEAGVPAGVLQVLTADKQGSIAIGKVLCESQTVRKISFTGSTEVGRILMKQSANSLKRLSLELGGHAPFIVLRDADLEAAVEGAMQAKYGSSGQRCVCANRFLVHQSIYETFGQKLAQRSKELKLGNGLDTDVQQGPLIDAAAIKKVQSHVDNALSLGARCLTGGSATEITEGVKHFFQPTVLMDVSADMLIMQEETFGPVCAITPFETDEQAIEIANSTPFGLAAYVYTQDINRAYRFSEMLEFGMVGVNSGTVSSEVAPFGGTKQSGFGREGSHYGIEEYLDKKYVCLGGF
jgi:succinate-semialdehyde dehydrogenase/glutarate-semialdehyde dehydrogenase